MQGAVLNVGGTQRHSAALSGTQQHSSSNQRSSRAISGTHLASAGTSQSGVPVSPMMTEFSAVRSSNDLKEGVAAYKEKRKPNFTGT